MVTIPILLATASLLHMEISFGASRLLSGLLGVDASNQPPSNPSLSTPSATTTSASSSASTIMASSTPSPILTADNITRIVNEHMNAGLAAAASAIPVRATPLGYKLKAFIGASKDWLNYNEAAVSAAAGATSCKVAILDSGAIHHLWTYYKAFIPYNHVYNQYVTLTDNSKIQIYGKGTIAIEMGRKKMIIRNVYHVPDLRLPLFSLGVHLCVPGCGYHSNNNGVFCFLSTFHMALYDAVDTYVSCRSTGRKTTKVFYYIHPCTSDKSAVSGSVPCRSACLKPPPPTPTLPVRPPAALPKIP